MAANFHNETSPYKHRPLETTKHIRLQKFERSGNTIHCYLTSVLFTLGLPYRALSYIWGPPAPTLKIYINNRPFAVRRNLYKFIQKYLEKLRRNSTEPDYLWIDQICINQSNVNERNQQVRLMSEVYREARCVIVWLGDTGGLYDIYLDTIDRGDCPSGGPGARADDRIDYGLIVRPVFQSTMDCTGVADGSRH